MSGRSEKKKRRDDKILQMNRAPALPDGNGNYTQEMTVQDLPPDVKVDMMRQMMGNFLAIAGTLEDDKNPDVYQAQLDVFQLVMKTYVGLAGREPGELDFVMVLMRSCEGASGSFHDSDMDICEPNAKQMAEFLQMQADHWTEQAVLQAAKGAIEEHKSQDDQPEEEIPC